MSKIWEQANALVEASAPQGYVLVICDRHRDLPESAVGPFKTESEAKTIQTKMDRRPDLQVKFSYVVPFYGNLDAVPSEETETGDIPNIPKNNMFRGNK